jgi:hypothetical protein
MIDNIQPLTGHWEFNGETMTASMRGPDLIHETVQQMIRMEEEARLSVVIEFLRGRGYTVIEPE